MQVPTLLDSALYISQMRDSQPEEALQRHALPGLLARQSSLELLPGMQSDPLPCTAAPLLWRTSSRHCTIT